MNPIILQGGRGWTVTRVEGKEVFTSPDGAEFVRTSSAELADVIIATRIGDMFLKRGSASRLVKNRERRERRLAKRVNARKGRKA